MKKIIVLFISCGLLYISLRFGGSVLSRLMQSCIIVKDSPAFGCRKYLGGCISGCSGKTIIKDLTVNPSIKCLTIKTNNCNGGVIDIINECGQNLKVGNLELPFRDTLESEENNLFTFFLDDNGNSIVENYFKKPEYRHPSWYKPYEFLTVNGTLGEKPFVVDINDSVLNMRPTFECLTLILDPSAGPNTVVIKNHCEEKLVIGGAEIGNTKRIMPFTDIRSIEIVKDLLGNVMTVETSGNYSEYIPEKDEFLKTECLIGDKAFTIYYIKTNKFCE